MPLIIALMEWDLKWARHCAEHFIGNNSLFNPHFTSAFKVVIAVSRETVPESSGDLLEVK